MNKEKDVKDAEGSVNIALTDNALSAISYTKTNKLITALFMVTDIIDIQDPIRNKLRTLGADIVSDINSNFSLDWYHLSKICTKVDEILSFLEIANSLNLVSVMNSNILKKEFLALKQSILVLDPNNNLLGFFEETNKDDIQNIPSPALKDYSRNIVIRDKPTRLGVQRGNTLLQALSDKIPSLSDRKKDDFDVLKKQRREEIVTLIKENISRSYNAEGGFTITDIRTMAKEFSNKLGLKALPMCGEKTLQRELVSMVGDNVLNKRGSKRWSRYFLPA